MSWDAVALEKRRPVWCMAARFWTGDWKDPADQLAVAEAFSESGYTCDDLWKICTVEVAPVVALRLTSVSDNFYWYELEHLEPRITRSCPTPTYFRNASMTRRVVAVLLGLFMRSQFRAIELRLDSLRLSSATTHAK
jgi:hypothetical protein